MMDVSTRNAISAHLQLFKIKILGGVAASALLGAFLASPDFPPIQVLFFLLLGTALSYGGAAAWNQVLEVQYDQQMERTRDRPLPSGRLSVCYALIVGSLFAVLGVAILYFCVTPLTGLLSIAAFVSYVFMYTPLKRIGWYGTLVGTVPGALPAVGGAVSTDQASLVVVVALFFLMVFWQLPHFYAYLWDVKGDYENAGFQMLPYSKTGGLSLMKSLVVLGAMGTSICTFIVCYYSPMLPLASGVFISGTSIFLIRYGVQFCIEPEVQTSKRLFRSTIAFIAAFTCISGFSCLLLCD
jgi:protoheme IX farnesyltransferase